MSHRSAFVPAIPYPSWIEIAGFKSIKNPARIDIRPLTLLAGANSSGKSSIFQTLLLLKQSIEVLHDPNPLLLNGSHMEFTSLNQFLSRGRSQSDHSKKLEITFGPMTILLETPKQNNFDVKLDFTRTSSTSESLLFKTFVRKNDSSKWIEVNDSFKEALLNLLGISDPEADLSIYQERLFTALQVKHGDNKQKSHAQDLSGPIIWTSSIFHLPGHRGHRERRYPITKVTKSRAGDISVRGPMPPYAASLLLDWQQVIKNDRASDNEKKLAQSSIDQVNDWLTNLDLTRKIISEPSNAADLELRVGRLLTSQQEGSLDWVDIADVGFGISQVLPVLVALAAAAPGQMVLIEQPELHLHPRAQLAMGKVLAEAANRGVIVVAETHSQLILRAIQTIIARGELTPDKVGLNWCARDQQTGWSTVTPADLHNDGTFGDWPVDFPDIFSMADQDFLDAVFGDKESE